VSIVLRYRCMQVLGCNVVGESEGAWVGGSSNLKMEQRGEEEIHRSLD